MINIVVGRITRSVRPARSRFSYSPEYSMVIPGGSVGTISRSIRSLISWTKLPRSRSCTLAWTKTRRRPFSLAISLRSEEHTSELQSPYDLVCWLLLEKKKQGRFCGPELELDITFIQHRVMAIYA